MSAGAPDMTGPALLPGRFGLALLVLGALALAALPWLVPSYYVTLGTVALIYAMLALSMQLLVGCTGLVSLGHGAFYGLAAYSVYLLSPKDVALPIWMTLPVAMLSAGLAALLIGAIALRTKGFFFLMVTLAFGQMLYFVFHDTGLGGGTDGAYLAKPLISAFGLTLDPQSFPRRQRGIPNYYVALIMLIVMYVALTLLMRSLFGRVLEGIRVNEHRMQALGFNTFAYKLAAFTIAGMLAGVAGHMWAMHSGFVNPELVGWHKSAEALLMILLGGLGSLAGPIVGALAFTALGEVAGLLTERKLLVEGIVILLVVLVLPRGLSGLRLPGFSRSAAPLAEVERLAEAERADLGPAKATPATAGTRHE
jgi:branched-chain amino acid transport system permease protein